MNGVVVLNASYEPLHQVSFKHAVRMLFREVAVVEEALRAKSRSWKISAPPMRRPVALVSRAA